LEISSQLKLTWKKRPIENFDPLLVVVAVDKPSCVTMMVPTASKIINHLFCRAAPKIRRFHWVSVLLWFAAKNNFYLLRALHKCKIQNRVLD